MIKRAYTRFKPESLTMARIRLISQPDTEILSVVRDESYSGCSVILQKASPVKAGTCCLLKTGDLGELRARVAWIAPLKDGFVKAGFEYLE